MSMEQRENELWGHYAEWAARRVYALDKDRTTYHDARDEHGPVETKACKRSVGAREDCGKFFIREQNHERLKDADGRYAFVLYDPEDWKHGPILKLEMKPAGWVDSVEGYHWTANGSRRGETVIRPPWTAVFADAAVTGVCGSTVG